MGKVRIGCVMCVSCGWCRTGEQQVIGSPSKGTATRKGSNSISCTGLPTSNTFTSSSIISLLHLGSAVTHNFQFGQMLINPNNTILEKPRTHICFLLITLTDKERILVFAAFQGVCLIAFCNSRASNHPNRKYVYQFYGNVSSTNLLELLSFPLSRNKGDILYLVDDAIKPWEVTEFFAPFMAQAISNRQDQYISANARRSCSPRY